MWSSPGEVRLIELCGGWVWSIRSIKNLHNGHYFTPAYSLGRYFKNHGIEREVKVGKGEDTKFVDFATYSSNKKKAIEILSNRWHFDMPTETKRRQVLKDLGWDVLYIQTLEIKYHPQQVQQKVMKFLSR